MLNIALLDDRPRDSIYRSGFHGRCDCRHPSTTEPVTAFAIRDITAMFEAVLPPPTWGSSRSDDERQVVSWGVPPHGPGHGTVVMSQVDGSEAVGWAKEAECPEALVTPDGSGIIVFGELEPLDDVMRPCDFHFYVLDPSGGRVREWRSDEPGHLVGMSANGQLIIFQQKNLIRAMSLTGATRWTIGAEADYERYVVKLSPDRRMMIAHDLLGAALKFYRLN